jgi:flavodoxin
MTTLVVNYSLTGHTATVANSIADRLGAEAEPIVEQSARGGLLGIAAGAVSAFLGRTSAIAAPLRDPSKLDLVILGTPVWAGAPAPAVNAYIDGHRDALDRVAFFCTQGKVGASGALSRMERRLGHPPLATLVVNEDEIGGSGALNDKIEVFLSDLRDAADHT